MLLSLQACRAVAAALVVLFHLGGTFAQDRYFGFKALDGPFAWADAGVEFFFVLSGFLITAAHRRDFGQPQALPGYMFKRLLRIYPTYWVICAAVCLAALAVPALRGALPTDPATWLKALALVPQDPAVVGGTGSPILFVAWSLQYEMLFYGVVAVAVISRAAGGLAAAALLLASLGCQLSSSCSFPLSFVDNPMVFLFAMGVAGAYLARSTLRLPAPLWLAAAAAVAFVAFGLYESAHGRDTLAVDRRWVYGALATVVIVALARAESSGRLTIKSRWPGLLGDASYALYLLHIPVISVLVKLVLALHVVRPAALVLAFVLIALACVAAAVAFHLLVEKPMLAWFRRHLGARVMGAHGTAATLQPAPTTRPTQGWQ